MTDVTSHSDGPRGQWILKHEHFVKRFGRIELLSLLMITCANCMLPPATAGLIATGPSQPAVGSSGTKGPIEAGCTFSGGDLQGDPGTIFRVACPQDCDHGGWLEGTDVYTSGSSICSAGIHAGAIPAGGGVVTVRIERGRPAYRGTARNGIESHDTGSADRSFAVVVKR